MLVVVDTTQQFTFATLPSGKYTITHTRFSPHFLKPLSITIVNELPITWQNALLIHREFSDFSISLPPSSLVKCLMHDLTQLILFRRRFYLNVFYYNILRQIIQFYYEELLFTSIHFIQLLLSILLLVTSDFLNNYSSLYRDI